MNNREILIKRLLEMADLPALTRYALGDIPINWDKELFTVTQLGELRADFYLPADQALPDFLREKRAELGPAWELVDKPNQGHLTDKTVYFEYKHISFPRILLTLGIRVSIGENAVCRLKLVKMTEPKPIYKVVCNE